MLRKRIILFSLITFFFSFISQVSASSIMPLTNYLEVLSVLQKGNHVQSVSNFNQCTPSSNDNVILGTIEFNHAIVYNKIKNGKTVQVIGMSNTIEVTSQDERPSNYTKNYIRLHLYEDNTIEFFVQELSSTGSPISNKSYVCQLNKGVSLYPLS
jgi:hypothetical protein